MGIASLSWPGLVYLSGVILIRLFAFFVGSVLLMTPFVGAVPATSGDSRRFLLKDGIRYSHVLDPATGSPVANSPASVTVAADTCVEADIICTMAMLEGGDAEPFLQQQALKFWCQRD